MHRPPSFHELWVWDGLPAETEGILWTGEVTSVVPRSPHDGDKTAEITAEGWLSKAAETDTRPPASVGENVVSAGVTAGVMVGATLSSIRMLHPPGPIDAGTFPLGAVGLADGKALDLMRRFEEAELGFLHETNEGPIGFEDRAARTARPVTAVWADHAEAQFRYRDLELLNWRREIINRVEASLSPLLPTIADRVTTTASTAAGVANDVDVILPDATFGAAAGDVAVVVIASTIGASGVNWLNPTGWTPYRDAGSDLARLRIYAKRLDTADLGATVKFYDDTSNAGGAYVADVIICGSWYGDVAQGLAIAEVTAFGVPLTVPLAAAGENNPPAVFPSWAPAPSVFLAFRGGMASLTGATVAAAADALCPNDYGDMSSVFQNGATNGSDVALQHAIHIASGVAVEQPSPFGTGEGVFEGFVNVETVTIAVRGYSGDPPETQGGQTVRVDDFASQDRVNAIRTHSNAANLFGNTDDAGDYAGVVLATYSDDRPIFRLTFHPIKTAAYRNQAIRRRVGHRIRLVADRTTGMGVDGEFFIENIRHRWANAGTWWETTWELSPA
jgi:hypothetical protein